VRKFWLLSLIIGLVIPLFSISYTPAPSTSAPKNLSLPPIDIRYKAYNLPSSVVHTLLIPAQSRFLVTVALSPELDTLENFAQTSKAIAALNGGFFDPINYETTSYVVKQGKLIADPHLNERLINNPHLAYYLDKILNRAEFRRYLCGQTPRYDIVLHNQPALEGCQLIDAIGGGPRLLPQITSVQEGFSDVSNGQITRDALGSSKPNARTAVGITRDGSLVWVMVAQKSDAPASSGMSLLALAEFMKTLGVEKAINLDGGSSSALYYQGKSFYGKVDTVGNRVKRRVKSVLLVQIL
jgi:hypothetical protein